jgi:uncharacterized membrane protein
MNDAPSPRRPRTAGILLGIGLGGFFDGILFHQILQTHNMLTGRLPKSSIPNIEVNMFWDGIFHAATWTVTLVGVLMLWNAGRQGEIRIPIRGLLGTMFFGWGLFNLVEGAIDHELLGIHHVIENASNHLPADLAFLASGVIFMLVGRWMER